MKLNKVKLKEFALVFLIYVPENNLQNLTNDQLRSIKLPELQK